MFRFIYVIIANLFRGPVFIPKMRKMAANPEKYSDEARYAYCKYAIHFMMKSGHISTDVYGLENLPKDTGYVMFPNHQGKYDALGIIYAHEEPCSFVMDEAKSNGFLVKEIVNLVDAKRLKINDVRHGLKIMNEITEDVKVAVFEGFFIVLLAVLILYKYLHFIFICNYVVWTCRFEGYNTISVLLSLDIYE